jgi:predicted Zn finger-like uncharacterized protein
MATSLATRCPACHTVFRVVPDQLRVAEGWVKCGRCSKQFDAAAALVDADFDPGQARRGAESAAAAAPPSPTSPLPPAPAPEPEAVEFELDVAPPATAPTASFVPAVATPDGTPDFDADGAPRGSDVAAQAAAAPLQSPAGDAPPGPSDARPSFVRRAELAERWRQPRVRAALIAACALGVVGLAAQGAYEFRDLAAAHMEGARPALEQACAALGCRIDAVHAIEGLSVESSGLVRVEKSNIYKLSVALRSRAAIDIAMPALDLSLTDVQGRLLARRVLRPAELGAVQPTVGAGRELVLQATLQASTDPVVGYTIELFYP